MVFPPDELADWLGNHVLPELEMDLEDIDLARFLAGLDIGNVDELQGNLVIMLHEGRSHEEVFDYAMGLVPYAQAQIRDLFEHLKSPLAQIYAFSYGQGKKLMEPLLEGESRDAVFRRLLAEQVSPPRLREWS